MGAQIIFICGFLLLTASLMCIKKVPERVSFLRSLIICYITELCLGAVLAGVYSVVKQPIELFSMGIGYLVLALMVWGWIIYKKEIQKFEIYAVDVYSFLVVTLFFGLVFLKVFTPEIGLIYKNSDPGVHYGLALRVMKTGQVRRMYFAELYNSLVMQLFQPFLEEISLYKAFILADSFSNYVNILMFYVLLSTIFKSKLLKALPPFLCVLYFLGWPFYSYVVGGYVYFGIGVTLFMYVIYLILAWKNVSSIENKKVLLLLIILGIYSITICYMLFTPVLCLAIILSAYYFWREKKIKIPRKILITVLGVTVSLGVILFCVCFFGYFGGNFSKIFSSFQIEGGIHRELYKDFLFLIPPLILRCIYYWKNKVIDYIFLTYIAIGGCTVIVFILCLVGGISGYYFYKLYYLNWCFLWLIAAQGMEKLWTQQKTVLLVYGLPVSIAIVMMFTGLDEYLISRDLLNADSPSILPIYSVTKRYIEDSEEPVEMQALRSVSRYINENLENCEQGILMISSVDKHNYAPWYEAFTGYKNKWANRADDPNNEEKNFSSMIQQLEKSGQEYVLIMKTADGYIGNEDCISEYEVVYDDGYFGLYKMN